MKYLPAVLEKVFECFTKEQELEFAELWCKLKSIQESAQYTHPEESTDLWMMAGRLLGKHLGKPDEPWKKKISDIMAGNEGEEND